MYLVNKEFLSPTIKRISDTYGAPYRRLLRDLKKYGNAHFRIGGKLYIVKKINKL